jgi:magnesium transporter
VAPESFNPAVLASGEIHWLNLDGIDDFDSIKKIAEVLNLHPLTLEDITNPGQRPKYEDFDNYIYIVARMIYFDRGNNSLSSEQISLVLSDNIVISLQERRGDVFDPIRERIQKAKGRVRQMKADYLAYTLIDAIVDNYFFTLEEISERTQQLEEELLESSTPETLQSIHSLKREAVFIKKAVWPLREVINRFIRDDTRYITKTTRLFLRDVYDHTIQVIETLETLRDIISGMVDIYVSVVSNKMNEIMKVLTIFAAIFIPLTFVAGIYGMNFKYMPELNWQYGYPAILLFMLLIAGLMLIYFKRRKWF